MALIDVSDLMSDPDFVDIINVITRSPYVNYLGENKIRETILATIGSVQPADVRTVQKLPEAMRVESLYSFWFKGEIVASDPGLYSSILVFKDQRYQVKTVANWSNWGAGYTEGVAVMEIPAP